MGFICCFETGLEPFSLHQAAVIFVVVTCRINCRVLARHSSTTILMFFIHDMDHLGITCILNISAFKAKLSQVIQAVFIHLGLRTIFIWTNCPSQTKDHYS